MTDQTETLRAFDAALDEVVASDPQHGYSRERQRGWDEAIATVRSIRKRSALSTPPAAGLHCASCDMHACGDLDD